MSENGTKAYDAIVVGAGHNGLITANYLARAGRRVLVLEARDVVGGACVTEELIPGAKWSSCAFIAGLLRPELLRDLELEKYGLELYQNEALEVGIFPDGSHLFLWKDMDRTLKELAKFSEADAKSFLDFGLHVKQFASIITPFLMRPPTSRSEVMRAFEEAGAEGLFDEFVLSSIKDLLDRYFESGNIKGLFTFFGMVSIWGGPSTPGTAGVYGHHSVGEFKGHLGQWGLVKGGMGGITGAIAKSAEAHGAVIRTGSPVAEVLVSRGRTTGVRLKSGEIFRAPVVVSNADPLRSLDLLPSGALKPAVRKSISQFDYRGSMARIHLLIDELPEYIGFPPGRGPQHEAQQIMNASVETFELAWEAQRRGELPDEFVVEAMIQSTTDPTLAPPGKHTMTLGVLQIPYELAGTTWDEKRDEFADAVLETVFRYAPNLRGHVLDRVVLTPLDLEREYHLTGGNIFHGAMYFDQLFGNRPIPALADYRTPVGGYYLCGSGTHPGGGVIGANGHNAAKTVLEDLDGSRTVPSAPVTAKLHRGLPDRVMGSRYGRELGYRVARQPALRQVVKFFTRSSQLGSKAGRND
ncbi:phytoene desaturase family protein [Amycolatopsis pithecellobii]|uniref:Pyridine nucleotide-disulfide oxidoreductase domain-containing protein 2 n=1 Tax=Amycolatopsis pithecellobii TaxID=664692 RepID=A0A6N7YHS4_9PSEU|nr:NAD(P)/FAD-dependent oxidoreductase [Amycolatopsis pithecellobii]MTD52447.1 FAD-dependent oxidoreductase [Amycolatopsis pithecellobii]